MEKSPSIQNLAKALSAAQGEMGAALMSATNPFLKNKYADLGEVIKASKGPLKAHGLSVAQPISGNADFITVTTILMHESGEWIEEAISLPLVEARGKSQAQEAGSIITYLRRYSLASMLGIYADEDTDGNENKPAKSNGASKPAEQPANGNGNGNHAPEPEQPAEDDTMTLDQAKAFITPKGAVLEMLTTDQLSQVIVAVQGKRNKTEYDGRLLAAAEMVKASREA